MARWIDGGLVGWFGFWQGALFCVDFMGDSPFVLASGGSNGKLCVWDTLENPNVARHYARFATPVANAAVQLNRLGVWARRQG